LHVLAISVPPALCSANWKPVDSVGQAEATAWELSAADYSAVRLASAEDFVRQMVEARVIAGPVGALAVGETALLAGLEQVVEGEQLAGSIFAVIAGSDSAKVEKMTVARSAAVALAGAAERIGV
jgi:hypothetical protein